MSRLLTTLGIFALAAAAWFSIANASGWVSTELYDQWFDTLFKGGAMFTVAGVGFNILDRVRRGVAAQRCARCNRPIARGHIYCADHLKASIDEARDALREREARAPRAR